MNSVQDMPRAVTPSTCNCSYHEPSSRHAGEFTIRGDHAHCCTFVEISLRAGADPGRLAGACHRCDCRFEDMLECPASPMNADAGGANGPLAR